MPLKPLTGVRCIPCTWFHRWHVSLTCVSPLSFPQGWVSRANTGNVSWKRDSFLSFGVAAAWCLDLVCQPLNSQYILYEYRAIFFLNVDKAIFYVKVLIILLLCFAVYCHVLPYFFDISLLGMLFLRFLSYSSNAPATKEKRPREDSSLHDPCLSSMCSPDGPTARKDDASSRWQLGPCPKGWCFGNMAAVAKGSRMMNAKPTRHFYIAGLANPPPFKVPPQKYGRNKALPKETNA